MGSNWVDGLSGTFLFFKLVPDGGVIGMWEGGPLCLGAAGVVSEGHRRPPGGFQMQGLLLSNACCSFVGDRV